MILELVTKSNKKVKVRAHRVLKNTYPNLELYVHYAVDDDEKSICTSQYNVSSIDGISIAPSSDDDIFWAIEGVKYFVHKYGENEIHKRLEEYRKNPLSKRWGFRKQRV